jgi:hypothetical protein
MTYTKQEAIQQTKKRGLWAALSINTTAILLMGLANPAAAHVSYVDLSDPVMSPGGVNGGSFSNFGWYEGTTASLGDSHGLAGGDFFKFTLTQASKVSITFSDPSNTGSLNPAFSLYNGFFSDEAHDDTLVDPLNPAKFVSGHVVKSASPVDDGVTTDWLNHVSAFRDTAHVTYKGQFDALHSWSMANESGDWSVAEYITHAGPNGGNSVSLTDYYLPAGFYTIAAAGGTAFNVNTNITGLSGTVAFSASPVPLPATVWLFGSAVAGFAASRRKRKV